jgi:DNA-directed RNA polymerase specialized sigma24 family protein
LGKYKIIDFIRKNKKIVNLNYDQVPDKSVDPKLIEEVNLTDRQKSLTLGIRKLGKKCQDVITLFYSQQLSIAEIADRMGYKTENVVKAHKSRCMKTLKQIVSTIAEA